MASEVLNINDMNTIITLHLISISVNHYNHLLILNSSKNSIYP